ncbi:MAG TPA: hypothetical protein VE046_02920 [Steroidobacteraceae bacterium]|nr:hypothetical protein [Steroidobacteraceae bacterium]
MNPLRYTFLQVVLQRLRIVPQRDPVPIALCVTVMLAGLNLMTVALLVRHWWNWGRLFQGGSDVRLAMSFALVVGIGALQYRSWVAGGRLIATLAAVTTETAPRQQRHARLARIYVIASVVALVGVVALLAGGILRFA